MLLFKRIWDLIVSLFPLQNTNYWRTIGFICLFNHCERQNHGNDFVFFALQSNCYSLFVKTNYLHIFTNYDLFWEQLWVKVIYWRRLDLARTSRPINKWFFSFCNLVELLLDVKWCLLSSCWPNLLLYWPITGFFTKLRIETKKNNSEQFTDLLAINLKYFLNK